MERITMNLTDAASQAMERAKNVTGESKTDIVNHALLLYAIVREAIDQGGEVHIKQNPKDSLQRVLIL